MEVVIQEGGDEYTFDGSLSGGDYLVVVIHLLIV